MPFAVEMRGITKRFGDVVANDHIDLQVQSGHIHAILGENGAGKSTLMHILYGQVHPDQGEIFLHGKPVHITSPAVAINLGIGMVHQHFMLLYGYTVPENVALGAEPTKGYIFVDHSPVREAVLGILGRLDISLDLDTPVQNLSIEEQQIVEIIKALYRGAEILILDEPTAVLTPQKVEKLLDILKTLREDGKTIILITHKLEEALAVADEITVLRGGRRIATLPRGELDRETIVEMMVGVETVMQAEGKEEVRKTPLLSVRGLSIRSDGRYLVEDVSFEVEERYRFA